MTLPKTFARALVPMVVVAAPVAAAESPDMARLNAHIRSVHTMTANFIQTDARGRSAAGTLQLKRPGKVRFAYGSGDLLLVSNGKTLTFIDYQVGQKSGWPLSRTPLGVLLSDSPNLKGRAQIVPSQDPRVVSVRARDPAQYGSITLVFLRSGAAPGGLQLYGWTAIDAQNKRTTVKLGNVRYNVAVPESAFNYAEPKPKRH
ncbi:LolA family protein [Sphingomonas sp. URHD0057]|uniref:LolA family protein n=1 Tax=Sphingomonas sp. URHD0057 TaxID=1380389 RepID=UPI00048D2430|nr:outer membrane lipoprotein carrier protein LolA [Sphingomonas sp. URHD0057]